MATTTEEEDCKRMEYCADETKTEKWRRICSEVERAGQRLQEELECSHHPPGFSYLALWESYQKAYSDLCIESMKRRPELILKQRPSGRVFISVMRCYISLRSKYLLKTGGNGCDLEMEPTVKDRQPIMIGCPLDLIYSEEDPDRKDPKTRLVRYLEYLEEHLKKWSSPMEKRTLTEELIDLVTVDGGLEKIEDDIKELFLIYPEESLEIIERKMSLVEILRKKWDVCSEQIPNQLKYLDNYRAFKANWESYLKAALPIPPGRELILLKQLIAKPELEVARSVEEIWKVLDFTYGQDISIIKIEKAHLKTTSSQEGEEDTVMVTVLRPEIDPPIGTHAVQLLQKRSFKEQRSAFPCLRSCKRVDCDHNALVFDGVVVEEEATPMGLGMKDRDILGILPRYHLLREREEIMKTFGGPGILTTIISRTIRELSVGLNTVIGKEEGGVALVEREEKRAFPKLSSKKEEEKREAFVKQVFVGPVRNTNSDEKLPTLPIVQFKGVTGLNSVDDLIRSWYHYALLYQKDEGQKLDGMKLKKPPTWDEKMILKKNPPSLSSSFLGWNRCQESPHKLSKSGHWRILRKLHFSILKKRIFKRLVKIDFFRK